MAGTASTTSRLKSTPHVASIQKSFNTILILVQIYVNDEGLVQTEVLNIGRRFKQKDAVNLYSTSTRTHITTQFTMQQIGVERNKQISHSRKLATDFRHKVSDDKLISMLQKISC